MSDDGSMEVEKKKKKKDKRRDTVPVTDTEMSTAAATATTDDDTDSGEVDRAKIGISVIAHPLANRKLTKKCLKLVKKGQHKPQQTHRPLSTHSTCGRAASSGQGKEQRDSRMHSQCARWKCLCVCGCGISVEGEKHTARSERGGEGHSQRGERVGATATQPTQPRPSCYRQLAWKLTPLHLCPICVLCAVC